MTMYKQLDAIKIVYNLFLEIFSKHNHFRSFCSLLLFYEKNIVCNKYMTMNIAYFKSYLIHYQTYIPYYSKIVLFILKKLLALFIHKKALAYEI